jgi:hypothetical protein
MDVMDAMDPTSSDYSVKVEVKYNGRKCKRAGVLPDTSAAGVISEFFFVHKLDKVTVLTWDHDQPYRQMHPEEILEEGKNYIVLCRNGK